MKTRIACLAIAFGVLLFIGSCVVKKVDQPEGGITVLSANRAESPLRAEEARQPKTEVRIGEIITGSESVRASKQRETRLPLPAKKRPDYVKGLLRTSLETRTAGDGVKLVFSLTNVSDRELKLTFGSGMRYDFAVYDDRNEEIYRWSNDKIFTQALIETKLKQAESMEFEEEWNRIDNHGERVPDGAYAVRLVFHAGIELPDGQLADPEQLTAEADLAMKKEQS